MPDGFHLWHFTNNKTYYTVWMSTTRKKQQAFNTLASSQSRQVEEGSRRCVYTYCQIQTHTQTRTQMSNSSDSISFVYTRSLTRIKRSDEATLCWWMFFSHLLNRPTSVFMESQKPSGRKRARVADRQGRGGRVESRVGMRKKKGDGEERNRGGEVEQLRCWKNQQEA